MSAKEVKSDKIVNLNCLRQSRKLKKSLNVLTVFLCQVKGFFNYFNTFNVLQH